jgi:8-oxo-dGTP pyrophosphatase MutT (NUDIX family)
MLLRIPLLKWTAQQVMRRQRSVTLGVRGLVIDADGHVLLVRHGYVPGWMLPGGGVDRGEAIHAAVARECAEETGVRVTGAPPLFGLYTNFDAFPGDHVALFVIREFTRDTVPRPSFEIREQGFFARDALPAATTAGTRRRLAEVFDSAAPTATW